MTLIPSACQGLYDQLQKIRAERNELSEELKHAAPGEKPFIANQIKALLPKLAAAEKAFNACTAAHPGLTVTFKATVQVAVKADKIVHTSGSDTLTFEIDPSGGRMLIASFPTLTLASVQVMGHDDSIKVKMENTQVGIFTKATGAMAMTAEFTVEHSIFGASDSKVTLHFTTGTVASPLGALHGSKMDATGHISLVAAGTLQGGSANGLPITVTMTGKLTPKP